LNMWRVEDGELIARVLFEIDRPFDLLFLKH